MDICSLMVSSRDPIWTADQADSVVYDERNLSPEGEPAMGPGTGSELWVIDAKRMHEGMDAVACRVKLPQRVPYGYVSRTESQL